MWKRHTAAAIRGAIRGGVVMATAWWENIYRPVLMGGERSRAAATSLSAPQTYLFW
jgi:hypothetical protein